MRLEFEARAFEDLQYWVRFQPKLAKRILRMIDETRIGIHSEGLGNPSH